MKHLNFTLKSFATMLFIIVALTTNAQVQSPRYEKVTANCKGYYEYLPEDYKSGNQSYPLLLFIHGMGETGNGSASSLPLILRNGPPRLIKDGKFPKSFTVNGKTFRFIVISPQFIKWPQPNDINSVIDYIVAHYRVDAKRIYLTGLSMGGGAAWNYAGVSETFAKRLAGLVTVCGASFPAVGRIAVIAKSNLPVWSLQNQTDPTVPVAWTRGYVDGLDNYVPAMHPKAKGTIFPAGGHDAWTHAYDPEFRENGMNVYEWLLHYSKDGATAPTPPVVVNKAPEVNAGNDVTITLPVNSTTLSAKSSDADGSVAKYSWSQISGPAPSKISNGATSAATFNGLTAGSYTVRLTITDDDGATSHDDVTITVKPQPLVIPGVLQAEQYASMSGVQAETTSDSAGGNDISWIESKDWMFYNARVSQDTIYTFSFRIASPNSNGQFQVKNNAGITLATINIPNTGGWQKWTTIKADIKLSKGDQSLTIYVVNGGWNINWFSAYGKQVIKAPEAQKPAPPATIPPTSTAPVSSSPADSIIKKMIEVGIIGNNISYTNKQWNGWNINPEQVSDQRSVKFKYTDGISSTITANLSHSEKLSDNSSRYGSGMAPKEVLRYVSYATAPRTLTIKGLSADKTYDIELYASRSMPGNSTIFGYKGQSKSVATYYNYKNKAVFTNLTADKDGTITISLKSLTKFNYLNGFTLTEKTIYNGRIAADESARTNTTDAKTDATPALNIYPNPVRDMFTLQLNSNYTGTVKVQIVNLSGMVVKTVSVNKQAITSQTDVYVKELPAGIYVLQTESGNAKLAKKLLKQ